MKTNKYFYILLFLFGLAMLYPIRSLARTLRTPASPANGVNQQIALPQDIPTDQIIIKYKTPEVYSSSVSRPRRSRCNAKPYGRRPHGVRAPDVGRRPGLTDG